MPRYLIKTTVETQGMDEQGQPITIPAGTVVNEILWDGVTPVEFPEGVTVEPAE